LTTIGPFAAAEREHDLVTTLAAPRWASRGLGWTWV